MISTLIPGTLDEIIREHRDLFALGLSTTEEIQPLSGEIQVGQDKDIIDDWRFISLRDRKAGQAKLLLLGHSKREHSPWITSALVGIDFARNSVLTQSGSFYRLGSPGIDEPPRDQLIHVCATLHTWGSGVHLGVPHFFY